MQAQGKFASWHPQDRNFVLACLIVIMVGTLGGFIRDMLITYPQTGLRYPLIVHLHALAYTGWLALFAAQTLLIRTRNVALHRSLGMAAVVLLPLMIVLGPATALTWDALHYGHPRTAFPFMSTQFTNVLGASVLIIAGLIARKSPAAHKRLMLMGTIALTEPGFSRLYPDVWSNLFWDKGFWAYFPADFIGTELMMIAVGWYDLATRRRLHPAYVAAFVWILANEATAAWLYQQPWWAAMTTHLVGH